MYHVFGFVGCSLLSAYLKSEVVFPHPGFSSDAALNATEARATTVMLGTPTMIIDILNNEDLLDYNVSSLRYLTVGGAPVTTSLVAECEEKLGAEINVGYGMTENSCGTITTNSILDPEARVGAVGRPLPGVEVKIIDPITLEVLG